MNDSNDISRLYRQFGGDPDQYREIGRTNQAIASRQRWPLLAAIQPGQGYVPPAVGSEPADSVLPRTAWPPAATIPEASMLFPIEPATAISEPLFAAPPLYAAPPVQGQDQSEAAEPHVVPARMEPFAAATAANQADETAPAPLPPTPLDLPQVRAIPQPAVHEPVPPSSSLQSVFARLAQPARHDVRAETSPPLSKLANK